MVIVSVHVTLSAARRTIAVCHLAQPPERAGHHSYGSSVVLNRYILHPRLLLSEQAENERKFRHSGERLYKHTPSVFACSCRQTASYREKVRRHPRYQEICRGRQVARPISRQQRRTDCKYRDLLRPSQTEILRATPDDRQTESFVSRCLLQESGGQQGNEAAGCHGGGQSLGTRASLRLFGTTIRPARQTHTTADAPVPTHHVGCANRRGVDRTPAASRPIRMLQDREPCQRTPRPSWATSCPRRRLRRADST